MQDPQYQPNVTPAVAGQSATVRVDLQRRLIIASEAGSPLSTLAGGGSAYQAVAASQTNKILGATGATGDYLGSLVITVGTAATAAVSIKDGAGSAIPIMPNSPGGGVGVYTVPIGAVSTSGAWQVTTGAGSSVVAFGKFT